LVTTIGDTAYVNQDFVHGGYADEMEVDKRFEDRLRLLFLRSRPLEIGGWFDRVWLVGQIEGRGEGIGNRGRFDAMVPMKRLTQREVFGARGDQVGTIIERILSLTKADVVDIEQRLVADPSLAERDRLHGGDPSGEEVGAGQSVTVAIDRRATAIDPDSFTDEEFPYSRTWHRKVWETVELVTYDAVTILAVSADDLRAQRAFARISTLLRRRSS
jgi:hypothetical protein